MAIEKMEMFTVICDNCKRSADEDSEYSCWGDQDWAEEIAENCDYVKEGDGHYCPSCYSLDENGEVVLKSSGENPGINKQTKTE